MAEPGDGFRLQPVLSYKVTLAQTAELELAELERERLSAEALLHELQASVRQQTKVIRTYQSAPQVDISVLQAAFAYLEHLRAQIDQQEQVCAAVAGHIATKRDELLVRVQEKKMLEKLRDRDAAEAMSRRTKVEEEMQQEATISRLHRERRDGEPSGPAGA